MPAFEAVTAQAIAGGGGTVTKDIDTRRVRSMTVITKLIGTVTGADLAANQVLPFLSPSDTSIIGKELQPRLSSTSTSVVGSDVQGIATYDLSGVEKVRLLAKNNNAGALTVTIDVFQEIVA
jgi:hypothetical protein